MKSTAGAERQHSIRLAPDPTPIRAEHGRNLLEVLAEAGIPVRSDCGGKGLCGKCVVRVLESSPVEGAPGTEAGDARPWLEPGLQPACRIEVRGSLLVEVPESSISRPEATPKPPLMHIDFARAPHAPSRPAQFPRGYGLAVDIGTTTIGAYLCDPGTRTVLASLSLRNPQAVFGDDVMSRIGAVSSGRVSVERLRRMVVRAIETGSIALCRSAGIGPEGVTGMAVVGNTTMIHLFMGEDPAPLGVYPFRPRFLEERTLKSADAGFTPAIRAEIHSLPLISGFLGSDVVAAALAADLTAAPPGTMLVDLGTNGEVMLRTGTGFLATSCATGPAFEGAVIRHGMPAVTGAVDGVKIGVDGRVTCSVMGNGPGTVVKPSGICGSGVVSAVSALLEAGVLLRDGRFNPEGPMEILRRAEDGKREIVLAPAGGTQTGRALTLTQGDVRAIQLAKGALRAGIEILCRETGKSGPERLLLAGAFGSFMNPRDGVTIGMLPPLPGKDLRSIGNAAGAGAILTLFDEGFRDEARDVARTTQALDLASHPLFQEVFLDCMAFPGSDYSVREVP